VGFDMYTRSQRNDDQFSEYAIESFLLHVSSAEQPSVQHAIDDAAIGNRFVSADSDTTPAVRAS